MQLEDWEFSVNRSLLIIRGACQTDKTALVNQFGQASAMHVCQNLELPKDQGLLECFDAVKILVRLKTKLNR